MPQCSSTCGARLRRPRLSRGFAARPGIGSILARSCGPEMSALAPLLGDKQTFGERVRNDAIDPTRKRSVHRSSYRRVLDTAPLPLVLRQRAIMMLAMSWRDWTGLVWPPLYIDLMRREAALGVSCAGESTNVTHAFQPSGRLALSKFPISL